MTDSSRERPLSFRPAPPDGGILTREELAAWFKVSLRTVDGLGVPCLYFSDRTPRYPVWLVRRWIEQRAGVLGGE